MAFEPLQTDETRAPGEAADASRDMDREMLFGCSGFLLASVFGYMLSIWPFIAFQQTERLATLGLAIALGPGVAAAVGMVITRRYKLAGACGFVGGALCTAIFMYLRLQHGFISAMAKQAPRPDYPESFALLVPGAYVLLCVFLAVLVMPNDSLA
ncbi:MAG: hypothetical protein SFX74_02535 [Fimbriimonadaceae bacterium]|nr:hypothetical protein [Fimbriimonadaceae bacterium]